MYGVEFHKIFIFQAMDSDGGVAALQIFLLQYGSSNYYFAIYLPLILVFLIVWFESALW